MTLYMHCKSTGTPRCKKKLKGKYIYINMKILGVAETKYRICIIILYILYNYYYKWNILLFSHCYVMPFYAYYFSPVRFDIIHLLIILYLHIYRKYRGIKINAIKTHTRTHTHIYIFILFVSHFN